MLETKTVRKWIWAWDFEKEERWLNDMAAQGWALMSVGFCRYTFERCEPGAYTIRLEMHPRDEAYLAFLQEIGATYIGRVAQWIYLRRRTDEGSFDLFSDLDSRIGHLKRIGRVLLGVGMGNLLIGLGNTLVRNPFGVVNLLLGTLLMYGLGRIHGKQEELEQERLLRE